MALSKTENELLTRVGPGTPMGELLREFWIPGVLSEELPEAGGKQLRLRLLGEDLVAFRDPDGNVGVVGEQCPHRGASLYFARNEECGLRCIYHGWKFDSMGHCIDMPNEPPSSRFKEHIKIAGYRTVERGQMVWVYMGQRAHPPEPPELEWSILPPELARLSKRVEFANWAQVLEGGVDSSHVSFLHAYLDVASVTGGGHQGALYHQMDRHPRYEIVDRDYGTICGARRIAEDKYYWRIYQYLMPFYTMIPPYSDAPLGGHAFVPRDDYSTVVWNATWHPSRELTGQARTGSAGVHVLDMLPPSPEPDGAWMPVARRENDYLRDIAVEKNLRFSGIPVNPMQDAAVQESAGAIYDRTREHLASADIAILHIRRRLMALAQALAESGTERVSLPGVDCPENYRVRPASLLLEPDEPWLEAASRWLRAEPGVLLPSV